MKVKDWIIALVALVLKLGVSLPLAADFDASHVADTTGLYPNLGSNR